MPSLERLKPFDGGDDDDDGLDKDLWVVVEKGSVCASADCVYRDPVSCGWSREMAFGGGGALLVFLFLALRSRFNYLRVLFDLVRWNALQNSCLPADGCTSNLDFSPSKHA